MSSLLCIELCAGSALLTATLVSRGFKGIAVDMLKRKRKKSFTHVCMLTWRVKKATNT
jgi:hypothetical protein